MPWRTNVEVHRGLLRRESACYGGGGAAMAGGLAVDVDDEGSVLIALHPHRAVHQVQWGVWAPLPWELPLSRATMRACRHVGGIGVSTCGFRGFAGAVNPDAIRTCNTQAAGERSHL